MLGEALSFQFRKVVSGSVWHGANRGPDCARYYGVDMRMKSHKHVAAQGRTAGARVLDLWLTWPGECAIASSMRQYHSSWTYRRLDHDIGVETSEWLGLSSPSLSAHFHEETQISVVSAGRRIFQIGQQCFQIAAGQFAVIPAGVPHISRGRGGVAAYQPNPCLGHAEKGTRLCHHDIIGAADSGNFATGNIGNVVRRLRPTQYNLLGSRRCLGVFPVELRASRERK